jgi:hypothetical protein
MCALRLKWAKTWPDRENDFCGKHPDKGEQIGAHLRLQGRVQPTEVALGDPVIIGNGRRRPGR